MQNLDPDGVYDFTVPDDPIYRLGLLAPYQLDVSIRGRRVIRLGRFSLGLLSRIRILGDPAAAEGPLLTSGAFCEAARDSNILLGGEHANNQFWNLSGGVSSPYFHVFMAPDFPSRGLRPPRVTTIGDNVILSAGSFVLENVSVGTGSVVAAGAVVIRSCPDYCVLAGVPARPIKERFSVEMQSLHRGARLPFVCPHSLPQLPAALTDLQDGRIDLPAFAARLEYLSAIPVVRAEAEITQKKQILIQSISGFLVGDEAVKEGPVLDQLHIYFRQVFERGQQVKWSPDIFRKLRLY